MTDQSANQQSNWIYQQFQYDCSVIDGDEYLRDLKRKGWQELDSSKEIEEHSWPLNYGRFNTHLDPNIEKFTLKRLAPTPAPQKQSDTPSKGVDAELDEILALHRSETWDTGWNNDATQKAKAATKALLKAQLDSLLAELPKKFELHPERDLDASEVAHDAYNQAIDQVAETIEKHREAL